jgi:uncharacterized damage-inducible protein DinB
MKAADVLPNYREELSRIPKLIENLAQAELDRKIVDHPKVRSIGDLARHQADVEGLFLATLVGRDRPPKLTHETHGDAASIVKAMAGVREQLAAHVEGLPLEDLNKTLKTAMGERAVKQVLWGLVSEMNNNRGQILLNLRLQNPDR